MKASAFPILLCAFLGIVVSVLAVGCNASNKQDFTRVHLANGSDAALVFLAIESSEAQTTDAANRLPHPLPPSAVYSAVLPRPGNYWIRTETEVGSAIVRRVIGPVRLGRGVYDWEYTQEDEVPLYQSGTLPANLAIVNVAH